MSKIRRWRRALAASAVIAAALGGFCLGWWRQAPPVADAPAATAAAAAARAVLLQDLAVTVYAEARPLSGLRLTDHRGHAFGPQRVAQHWSLLFFGYTHCPDVCPATLATLAAAYDRLQDVLAGHGGVQVVFVSVDPARDNAAELARYAAHFHPAFIGASGEAGALRALLNGLGGEYRRSVAGAAGGYHIDHTPAVFIVDPRGRVRGYLSQPLRVDAVVSRMELVRGLYEREGMGG